MPRNQIVAHAATCWGLQHLPAPESLLKSELSRMKWRGRLLHLIGSSIPNREARAHISSEESPHDRHDIVPIIDPVEIFPAIERRARMGYAYRDPILHGQIQACELQVTVMVVEPDDLGFAAKVDKAPGVPLPMSLERHRQAHIEGDVAFADGHDGEARFR